MSTTRATGHGRLSRNLEDFDPMNCPKCQAEMRTYERNGIHVDQCSECRGIFLDRGELEHLITAENAWAAAPAQQPAAPPPPPAAAPAPPPHQQPYYQDDRRRDDKYFDSKYYPRYDKKKKKRNFLEDLFD